MLGGFIDEIQKDSISLTLQTFEKVDRSSLLLG